MGRRYVKNWDPWQLTLDEWMHRNKDEIDLDQEASDEES